MMKHYKKMSVVKHFLTKFVALKIYQYHNLVFLKESFSGKIKIKTSHSKFPQQMLTIAVLHSRKFYFFDYLLNGNRMQVFKSSPTSCFSCNYHSVFAFSFSFSSQFLGALAKVLYTIFAGVVVDVRDQYRTPFIGGTGKLLCLRNEISCVRAWHTMCFGDEMK